MPCAVSIEEAVQMAEQRWTGYEFKVKTADEACGPCPICHEAHKDGFLVFASGYYFCRPGKHDGWLDDDKPRVLTPEQIAIRRHEAEIKALVRQQRELDRRVSAIERLNRSRIHERYHANLDEQAYEWWCNKGVECWAIQDYKLGYCSRCPTDKEHRPSYTIPLPNQERTALLSLRHRLAHAENGDKYRPEMAGLGTCLAFPHHLVDADRGIIVEGGIKSLVLGQYGMPATGILGKRGRFKGSWLKLFPDAIYIALDPDAQENAERLGHGIAKQGKTTYVATLPEKPDDMVVEAGSIDVLEHYLRHARRVH
jgi:hypothetical protein